MLTPMKSSAAISLFVRPRAASSATRRSVSVSSSDGRAPAADPPQLGTGLLRPEPGAELLEDRERLLERLARGLLLLGLSTHRAEAEQRAAALERVRQLAGSVRERSNAARRAGQVALGGCEQAAAARGAGHRPRASQHARAFTSYCSR